jgi:hypothetical protein
MRDGDWLVGWGCAATMYPRQMGPAAARVTLMPQGTVKVQMAAHDRYRQLPVRRSGPRARHGPVRPYSQRTAVSGARTCSLLRGASDES